jgi:hypothetical protein
MLDVMEELGLEPNATLHHFTHPTWFEDLGAFRKEENIQLFVDWSVFMFREYGHRIRMWSTFNEPTVCVAVPTMVSGLFFARTIRGTSLDLSCGGHLHAAQCYSFLAFITGMAPPSHIFNLVACGRNLLNMLKVRLCLCQDCLMGVLCAQCMVVSCTRRCSYCTSRHATYPPQNLHSW